MRVMGIRIVGGVAAFIAVIAFALVLGDILSNVTFWKSAFETVWTHKDTCFFEELDDKDHLPLAKISDAPALSSQYLKFPLRLNLNLNYFLGPNRAARITCDLHPTSDQADDAKDPQSRWLMLGPMDGDLNLWIDDQPVFSMTNSTAFPITPLPHNTKSFKIKIVTRTMQNGQLAMTSLFPISVAKNWQQTRAIKEVYEFSRTVLPFGRIMLLLGLSILFVVSFNLGIQYADVAWTMTGLCFGLVEATMKWRMGISLWWNYELQLAVYTCLAIALLCHINRNLKLRTQLMVFAFPTSISLLLALAPAQLLGQIVTGLKLTSWIQVVLFGSVAVVGLKQEKNLPIARLRARKLSVFLAAMVALGLCTSNVLLEMKGIWMREIMTILTISIVAALISTDLVLFHRGYFNEKAKSENEQGLRVVEQQKRVVLSEALSIGQTAQELLLPLQLVKQHNGVRIEYHCRPHITMAGDWMSSWEGPNGSVIVLFGDVSGKGPSAAIAMASIMTLSHGLTQQKSGLHDSINSMSSAFYDLFHGSIVSTWAGAEIFADGKILFAGGGSPGWILLKHGDVEVLPCRLSMIGLSNEKISIEQNLIQRETGLKILSVSDGVCGSSRQQRKFISQISKSELLPNSEIIDVIFKFAEEQNIADDRSLIILEPS
jgi:serine phosphatase RsbU (regulator of sigma subunit)